MRLPILLGSIAAVVALNEPASAGFFTYSEWAALPPTARAVYVAGLFDALTGFVSRDEDSAMTKHYSNCLKQAKMDNMQLANNMLSYGSSHPEFQAKPATGAFINYLIAMCGSPPAH